MAETDTKKVGVTKTFEPHDLRKWKSKWQNSSQYDTVKTVRDRFHDMAEARRRNCFWASAGTGKDGKKKGNTGSDWVDHWNMCYKLWSMWHDYIDGRSNLKSPTTFGPVQALMAEFMQNTLGVNLYALDEEDDERVKIWNHVIEAWEAYSNAHVAKQDTMKESAICGTSFTYNPYICREREVEMILSAREVEEEILEAEQELINGNPGRYEEIKKLIEKDKKAVTKKMNKVDYKDFAAIPVSVFEVFVDPSARCLRGLSHEAVDLVWRTTPSLEQFRAEFKNSKDTFVIAGNIDKVVPAKQAASSYTHTERFFELPDDIIMDDDQVELIRYYNKQTDKYIVIANDMVVRDGPLPYNHKELPWSVHKFIDWPHQFYGVGMAAVLESNQAEDETIRNLGLELAKRALTQVTVINTDYAEDYRNQMNDMEPNKFIETTGPVGDTAQVLQVPTSGLQGMEAIRNGLKEDAIITTGVNPMAYSIPKQGEAVRNNAMSLESTLKILRMGFMNWGEGWKETIKQGISVMKQTYPDTYTTFLDEAGREQKRFKKIKVKGYKISQGETGEIKHERIPEDEKQESSLELLPEYLSLNGDVKVEFNVEAFQPVSKALQMEKISAAMQALIPLLSNPQMLQAPGVMPLIKQYCDAHGISEKVTESLNTVSSEQEIEEAEQENEFMMQGLTVSGKPGRSEAHKAVHAMQLLELYTMKMSPEMMQDPQQSMQLDTIIQTLSQHSMTDNAPKMAMVDTAVQQAQSVLMPPPMPQGMPMDPNMMPPEGMPMDGSQLPPDQQMMGMDQMPMPEQAMM